MAEFEVLLPSLVEQSGDPNAGEFAKVSFVYVAVGQKILEGEDLIEMVTDKAAFNVPSPRTGVVKSIFVEEDQKVNTGDRLVILEVE